MGTGRVRCPGCNGYLQLPEEVRNRTVCCSLCRHTFQLPRRLPVPEDTIFAWLHEAVEDEDMAAAAVEPVRSAQSRAKPQPPPPAFRRPPRRGPVEPQAAHAGGAHGPGAGGRLRLVAMDQHGALFEFPAEMLTGEDFRCAFPRVCVHCLGRAHLSAHLVIFASQLRDSTSLEAEHQAGRLTIPQDRLGELHGLKLLSVLPKVPSVPHPGNLPMPYWVCDLCSGAGEISGQIRVNSATGRGSCRLHIRNLHVAGSFFAAVGGEGTRDYAKLRDFLTRMHEDRWDTLPSVVRHRLEQWCRPTAEERFLAYVPDRDFVRTEDGMAGLTVTTRRLVYHRAPRHQELPADKQLLIEVRSAGNREIVTIDAADWRHRSVTLDRGGTMLLRRALSEAHFRAVWR